MYNVKVFRFPSGCQVRTYSRPVGINVNDCHKQAFFSETCVWNDGIAEWETVRYNPRRQTVEPFTYQLANMMPDEKERDLERSALSSLSRTKSKVYFLSRSNIWDWFFTLTFDPQKVDSFDYVSCVSRLKNWLDTSRRVCPEMKYLIVPEKHKSGRFHFHGLFANCDDLCFSDSGFKDGSGKMIYNIGRYKLGWSTATKVEDNARVTQYISKYITKDLCMVTPNKKRYWASRNLAEAQTEEILLDVKEMEPYMNALEDMSIYDKEVKLSDLVVHYYEMGVEEDE